MQVCIEFKSGRLDLQTHMKFFSKLGISLRATGLLCGHVDYFNQGKAVKGIDYDIYPTLARKIGQSIASTTMAQYQGLSAMYFAHSYDYVQAGEVCTVLAMSGDNWITVNNSLAFFIQEMKKQLPIWKLEYYQDGGHQWLTANSQFKEDYHA